MGPADAAAMKAAVEAAPSYACYGQAIDRESASEQLAARMQAGAEKAAAEQAARDADKGRTAPPPKPKAAKPQDSTFEKLVTSDAFQYAAKYAVGEAMRGMFGIDRR